MFYSEEKPKGHRRSSKVSDFLTMKLAGRARVATEIITCAILINSTFIDPETRQAMGEQAVALAKAVGYSSAGVLISPSYIVIMHGICKRDL